ncbi:MAG TPA: site-specific integrase [bacterium]|nr:site-specific integrase [bacterium]
MRVKVHLRSYSTKKDKRRWLLIVREQGRPEQYIQLGPISKDEAEKRRVITLNDLLTGTYKRGPSVRLFFGEFCDRVLSEYVAGTRAPRTLVVYRECLVQARKHFTGWHLDQIRRQDLEKFLSELPIAGRTKNIRLSVLRVVLRKAVEWGYLDESPAEKIARWREESVGSRAMTPTELGRVLDTATSWESSVIKVMAFSGMRPGELSQLKFEDIRWDDGIVKVVSDHQRKTKNRKSRIIPLSPELEQLLRFLWDHWPNMQHGNGKEATPAFLPRTQEQRQYVFCHRDGRQVRLFRKCVASACRKAGVVGVTPHGLRKTFCSLLARGGVHPKVAQKLMGHSDVRMTMDIYTEIGDDQLRDAVNGLPAIRDLQKPRLRVVNTAVE